MASSASGGRGRVYYNENDPFAAAWLGELMKSGAIPNGEVDTRSIQQVQPADLLGFTACHFFAGIGGWAEALRLAGWPDDEEVWTGSCPCQPYSAAGKQLGHADPRHLWPDWFRLIRACRPAVVIGEQVEGAIRHGWMDLVRGDLAGEGYAVGMAVLGAHSVGAPHIRQRCYWVGRRDARQDGLAESGLERREGEQLHLCRGRPDESLPEAGRGGGVDRVADATRADLGRRAAAGSGERAAPFRAGEAESRRRGDPRRGGAGGLGDPDLTRSQGRHLGRDGADQCAAGEGSVAIQAASPWADLVWLPCRDHKLRPTESTLQRIPDGLSGELGYRRVGDRLVLSPLTPGAKHRIGRLRGYGNAINPYTAAAFIDAYRAVRG